MSKQKSFDDAENDVELERLLDVVAQEFHHSSTSQSWRTSLQENNDKASVQTSERQGNSRTVPEGDKKERKLKADKELLSLSVEKRTDDVCEGPENGLHEWHKLVHDGLAISQTCSEILHKLEKAVFEMQAITAAVQNQGDYLSQNASLILVREAKLEAVKEELERTLKHFRHIDDLVHEAHDPMLSATSVRFATLIEGLHNELTFLSAHREYKSTQEYTTKVADAQERITACLTDALATSFELTAEFTRKSDVYLHAVQEGSQKRLSEERTNTSAIEPDIESSAPLVEGEAAAHNPSEEYLHNNMNETESNIAFNDKALDASQHVLDKRMPKVLEEEQEVFSTHVEQNDNNDSEVLTKFIDSSLENVCKEFLHVLGSINRIFANKLSEKASLRRMFEMRVNFQLLELAQSHDTPSLTSSNSEPKGRKRKGSHSHHHEISGNKSAANNALEQFMQSNVSQYTNTIPLYVQTVCQSFTAIRLSLLQEILHTFAEKCVQLLRSLPAKRINTKMTNCSKSEELASTQKISSTATSSTQVNETLSQPLAEETIKNSNERNMERDEANMEQTSSGEKVKEDINKGKELDKNMSIRIADNSVTAFGEKMSTMQDVHLLPRITRCLIQLLYIILREEEELLGMIWLREEMVNVILIPHFTRGVVEEIYCIYRAQLVNVDDLHELVDAIREIDTMRQYWRLYKDSRPSTIINMINKSNIIDNNNNKNYSDAEKDINNNNSNNDEEYLLFLRRTRDVDKAKIDNLVDDAQSSGHMTMMHNSNINNDDDDDDDDDDSDDNVMLDKSTNDNNSLDSLWMRMIQDTQERIIFRASVFLRQERSHNQVINEQVRYYLDEDINSVKDVAHVQSKAAVEINNSDKSSNSTKQSMSDSIKNDVHISKDAHAISFHPCVVRAVNWLQLLYPVLELSVFAIFAEEAVRVSLHVIEELSKLMEKESRSNNNKKSNNNKTVNDYDGLGKVKTLLCTLSHLVYLHEELTHIGADITVVTKSLDLSKLLHSRLAISESARETKRDVDEALYNCFDNLVKEIDMQLTNTMQGTERKNKSDVQTPIVSVEHVAERIEHYVFFYISNESLRDDIMHPVQQRIAEMRNNITTTSTMATVTNAATSEENKESHSEENCTIKKSKSNTETLSGEHTKK